MKSLQLDRVAGRHLAFDVGDEVLQLFERGVALDAITARTDDCNIAKDVTSGIVDAVNRRAGAMSLGVDVIQVDGTARAVHRWYVGQAKDPGIELHASLGGTAFSKTYEVFNSITWDRESSSTPCDILLTTFWRAVLCVIVYFSFSDVFWLAIIPLSIFHYSVLVFGVSFSLSFELFLVVCVVPITPFLTNFFEVSGSPFSLTLCRCHRHKSPLRVRGHVSKNGPQLVDRRVIFQVITTGTDDADVRQGVAERIIESIERWCSIIARTLQRRVVQFELTTQAVFRRFNEKQSFIKLEPTFTRALLGRLYQGTHSIDRISEVEAFPRAAVLRCTGFWQSTVARSWTYGRTSTLQTITNRRDTDSIFSCELFDRSARFVFRAKNVRVDIEHAEHSISNNALHQANTVLLGVS